MPKPALYIAPRYRVESTEQKSIQKLHHSSQGYVHTDKKLRDELDEKQMDKMLKDSFPASDTPSTY